MGKPGQTQGRRKQSAVELCQRNAVVVKQRRLFLDPPFQLFRLRRIRSDDYRYGTRWRYIFRRNTGCFIILFAHLSPPRTSRIKFLFSGVHAPFKITPTPIDGTTEH